MGRTLRLEGIGLTSREWVTRGHKQLRNDTPQSRDAFSRKERAVVKAFRPEGVGSLLRWEDNAGHGPLLAPEG